MRLFGRTQRPDESHLWKAMFLDSSGGNYTGVTWATGSPEAPQFLTPSGNPLYKFMNAPPKKQFRIYSIVWYPLSLIVVIDDPDMSMRYNIDSAVHALPEGNNYSRAHGDNIIHHCRVYANETDENALVHDADGDSTLDAATDHRNPLGSHLTVHFSPFPNWIYPDGIDIGPHLMFEVSWGGEQNAQRIGGTLRFRWIVSYSLVPDRQFRMVFQR